jgi:hypothetical protein
MNRAPKLLMSVALLLTAMNGANADDLVYGRIYHVQNGFANWTGGWLDANGAGCQGNVTAYRPHRRSFELTAPDRG